MKRPLIITIIGWLFIVAGTTGIIYHARELAEIFSVPEVPWILIVRLLAIVGGWFTLKGHNWARWLVAAWIVYHVVLSMFHSSAELIMHAVIMFIVLIGLFNRKSNAYFRQHDSYK
jgi:hypothetical protein